MQESHPGSSEEEALKELRDGVGEAYAKAAAKIADADVLLLCTGAGFSADSGLAVYADVARVDAYARLGLQYSDICQPFWLEQEPELFWGFWGQCFNDYRSTPPHNGYQIVRTWVDQQFRHSAFAAAVQKNLAEAGAWPTQAEDATEPYFVDARPSAFFAFTSNVDAHHFDWFEACEIMECHGNVELYQCAAECQALWRAPLPFHFNVDTATMLSPVGPSVANTSGDTGAPGTDVATAGMSDGNKEGGTKDVQDSSESGSLNKSAPQVGKVRGGGRPRTLTHMPGRAPDSKESGFVENHPMCPHCKGAARPAILMFGDWSWRASKQQNQRWEAWSAAVERTIREWPNEVRAVVLEVGAGKIVPTVRRTSEQKLRRWRLAGADVCLVRINPDLPWGDAPDVRPGGDEVLGNLSDRVISVAARGLTSLERIEEALAKMRQSAEG